MEHKQLLAKTEQFKEEQIIVQNLFYFILQFIVANDPSTLRGIAEYPNLEQILVKGMLKTENYFLRNELGLRLADLISNGELCHKGGYENIMKIISLLLFKVIRITSEKPERCQNYYDSLSKIIEQFIDVKEFRKLSSDIKELVEQLANSILMKPINEQSASDLDSVL